MSEIGDDEANVEAKPSEGRIGAQKVEIVGVLVAAADGEDAGADHVGELCVTRDGSHASGINRASRSAIPRRRSASDSSMTPPSDERCVQIESDSTIYSIGRIVLLRAITRDDYALSSGDRGELRGVSWEGFEP
jgi:hypothetical protein